MRPPFAYYGGKVGMAARIGVAARTARAMGYLGIWTYTREDEPGTSLRAAGWVLDGVTDGGEWDCPSRPRLPGLQTMRKRRWRAPWTASLRGVA